MIVDKDQEKKASRRLAIGKLARDRPAREDVALEKAIAEFEDNWLREKRIKPQKNV